MTTAPLTISYGKISVTAQATQKEFQEIYRNFSTLLIDGITNSPIRNDAKVPAPTASDHLTEEEILKQAQAIIAKKGFYKDKFEIYQITRCIKGNRPKGSKVGNVLKNSEWFTEFFEEIENDREAGRVWWISKASKAKLTEGNK